MKASFKLPVNIPLPAFGKRACLFIAVVLFFETAFNFSVAQTTKPKDLVSGSSIPNTDKSGAGVFCLPSYSSVLMGLADANDDGIADLWIQSTNSSARGISLYQYKKLSDKDIPVFSAPIIIPAPFDDKGKMRGVIFQDNNGDIYALWRSGSELRWSAFDKKKLRFSSLSDEAIKGVPQRTTEFRLLKAGDNYRFLFGVASAGNHGPGDWPRVVQYTPEGFWPYDIAETGISGSLVSDWKTVKKIDATPLTDTNQTYYSFDGFASVTYPGREFIITGSRLGNIYAYEVVAKNKLGRRQNVVDARGNAYKNATVHAYVDYFKGPQNHNGIIAAGEGGIYFYADKQQQDKNGNLVFEEPVPVLQESPALYGGSLVVPNLVDWDGDGVLDIISGTSTGFILFFKNGGTNKQPQMQSPVRLKAAGYTIHIQPGYREDIQGPGEARWGYTCPNVTDWNEDGLPDIVLGDSRGKFTVYINNGTKTDPELQMPAPIYHKGLDMFGSWRVRPGVGKLNNRVAFINQDQDDELHLYWQIDEYNVEDGGKLKLENGNYIKGAKFPAGGVGRTRIEIVDWDGDGVKDLVLGTYGKQSIPEPENGLPFHLPKRGSTPLFLKNTGTEEKPVYAYHKLILFKGKPVLLGGHECGVATGYFGPGNGLNMVIGEENGQYIFYERKDLSW